MSHPHFDLGISGTIATPSVLAGEIQSKDRFKVYSNLKLL